MAKCEYVHPAKYAGISPDTTRQQAIAKEYVEANCLKCSLFCGEQHDFSECRREILGVMGTTCPLECRKPVPLAYPEYKLPSKEDEDHG